MISNQSEIRSLFISQHEILDSSAKLDTRGFTPSQSTSPYGPQSRYFVREGLARTTGGPVDLTQGVPPHDIGVADGNVRQDPASSTPVLLPDFFRFIDDPEKIPFEETMWEDFMNFPEDKDIKGANEFMPQYSPSEVLDLFEPVELGMAHTWGLGEQDEYCLARTAVADSAANAPLSGFEALIHGEAQALVDAQPSNHPTTECPQTQGKRRRAEMEGDDQNEQEEEQGDGRKRQRTQEPENDVAISKALRMDQVHSTANLNPLKRSTARGNSHLRRTSRVGSPSTIPRSAQVGAIGTSIMENIVPSAGSDAMAADVPSSNAQVAETSSEAIDCRAIRPTDSTEQRSLSAALQPTRKSFEKITGYRCPVTDRNKSYKEQYSHLLAAFVYHRSMQDLDQCVPRLLMLPAWRVSISNWSVQHH